MKLQQVKRQAQLKEWATQISEQKQSGMAVRQWCEANGLGHKNFYYRRKRVQEELLEAMEEESGSQLPGLSTSSKKELPVQSETSVAVPIPINMLQNKGAALTVWIGSCAVDIQNGADAGTINQVLRVVSQL